MIPLQNITTSAVTVQPVRKAVYALSADPVTYGHLNIIERAAKLFDLVVVAIGKNPDKDYLFSLNERMAMLRDVVAKFGNVEVDCFSGLLVDFAYEQCASVIIKGVRDNADFYYEKRLFDVGYTQQAGIDTHILLSDPQLSHISSGAAKALLLENSFVHSYVPLSVKQAMEQRILKQTIIGVTGEIATGKTTLCNSLVDIGKSTNYEIHHIDLDRLAHDMLETLTEPVYQKMRIDIIAMFGEDIVVDNKICRKCLGERVFKDIEALACLNKIMAEPLMVYLKRTLANKRGLIFLSSALLVEAELTFLCNNHVVLVKTDKDVQQSRLLTRGLTENQIRQRFNAQLSSAKKQNNLEQVINNHQFGRLWQYNSGEANDKDGVMNLLEKIIHDTSNVGERSG